MTPPVTTFEKNYDETDDAKAYGRLHYLNKREPLYTIFMLSYFLHTIAKLQGSLQSKELNTASIPTMVSDTMSAYVLVSHPI